MRRAASLLSLLGLLAAVFVREQLRADPQSPRVVSVAELSRVGALWLLLKRTRWGLLVRAATQDREMVGALGISLEPYMAAIAFIGIGLAGLAGVMLAPIFAIHPAMGQEIITSAFVVVVIGGLGSFWGVVIAAAIVGITKGAVTAWGYPQYSEAAIYLLMLLVLLVRPRGLLGERIVRFE